MAEQQPKFAMMDAVKMQIVQAFAAASGMGGLNPFEMLAVAISLTTDIVAGCVNGVLLAERTGAMPRAEVDDAIAGYRELYTELGTLDREYLTDLLDMAAQRHVPGAIAKFEAKMQEKERERQAQGRGQGHGRGVRRESLTIAELERMMKGKPKGEA